MGKLPTRLQTLIVKAQLVRLIFVEEILHIENNGCAHLAFQFGQIDTIKYLMAIDQDDAIVFSISS